MRHDVLFYGEKGTHIATMSNCASLKEAKAFASKVYKGNEKVLRYRIKNQFNLTVFSKGMRSGSGE